MATAKTVHGKKVVTRKPKVGDMVVSRNNGKTYEVSDLSGALAHITSTGYRGLTKPIPVSQIATLAVRQ